MQRNINEDLSQVLVLNETGLFPVLGLEDKCKSKELYNLKPPQGILLYMASNAINMVQSPRGLINCEGYWLT